MILLDTKSLVTMLRHYREAINPPYNIKKFPAIFGTFFVLLILPLTVLAAVQSRDLSSQAGGGGGPTPFGFWYDSGIYDPHHWTLADGTTCMGEDSRWERGWYGDMQPGQTFTVDDPYCDGGDMIFMRVDGPLGLTLTATSPVSGTVYQAHNLGIVDRNYVKSRCFVAPRMVGGSTGQTPIEGGHWKITLTNTNTTVAKKVTFKVHNTMQYPSRQQTFCPQEDWTFTAPVIYQPVNSASASTAGGSTTLSGTVNLTVKNSGGQDWPGYSASLNISNRKYSTTVSSGTVTTPPEVFTIPWDTTKAPNGIYTITGRIGLAASQWGGINIPSPITVEVRN